jgi:hypothetical protein
MIIGEVATLEIDFQYRISLLSMVIAGVQKPVPCFKAVKDRQAL